MKRLTALLVLALPVFSHAQPRSAAALEAINRQDLTGQGSFHRIGLLRQQEDTVSLLGKIRERVSGQVRANTMLFASDNIFNTPDNPEADEQIAEFIGASVKVAFTDALKLDTRYDAAFFRHRDDKNSGNDFDTRTFRQQLAYDVSVLGGKGSVSVPLSWQFSEVFGAGDSDAMARTWTYGSGLEFTWFKSARLLPTVSYNYFFTDPKVGRGKHKHDVNLGVTFIPIAGTKLFLSPSIQYSREEFRGRGRADDAWTPTVSASWEPLKFFAMDAVVSYTESRSSEATAEFEALAGTLFARLFWKW